MNINAAFLPVLTFITLIFSFFALETTFTALANHQTITFQDATGALVADLDKTELYEGFHQDIDVNQDAVPDTTLTLQYADNGKAAFSIKNAPNACQNH